MTVFLKKKNAISDQGRANFVAFQPDVDVIKVTNK